MENIVGFEVSWGGGQDILSFVQMLLLKFLLTCGTKGEHQCVVRYCSIFTEFMRRALHHMKLQAVPLCTKLCLSN